MNKQAQNVEGTLSVCPAPLPDRVGHRDSFFDSILYAHQILQDPHTVSEFLAKMLDWSGRGGEKSRWYLQNVMDAYYVIGLVLRVRLPKDIKLPIVSKLPQNGDPHSLRRYCLKTVTSRLEKMPTFWSAVAHTEPTTTREVWYLLRAKGFSLGDVKRRLRIMRNLSALQRNGHDYRLTQLGLPLVSRYTYARAQAGQQVERIAESSVDSDDYAESFGAIDFHNI